MALRIPRRDLDNFGALDLNELVGRRLEVRGWPHFRKGKWRMTLRHPAAMDIRAGN